MRSPREEYKNVPRRITMVTHDSREAQEEHTFMESKERHPRICTRYLRADGHRIEVYVIIADIEK